MNITPSNYIEQEIVEDIKNKNLKKIITRFPPEPNGFLHIGHCKALCIDFTTAEKFGGYTNLRFDDTNPAKEDVLYENAIIEDIKWLGFKYKKIYYASDYYDYLYDCAVDLIKQGKAYVCDLSKEEINKTRGTLTEPGTNSPYRNRTIEENLKLFAEMKEGKFEDGSKTLRAKIDMSSPNINFRDPVIYRIMRVSHYRQGNKWCIYPMYDFAHPLSDAKENITHSLCSLEYEDHRPLYDWFINNVSIVSSKPRQIEFARLNLEGTIMSKRYLKMLVDLGYVDGWDDPRMPTISALRRKGYTPESIKEFCNRIGVSKSNSIVKPHILEACVRDNLNAIATRVMAVINPLKVNITNYNKISEKIQISNNPTIKNSKKHTAIFSNELYIESEDFMEIPASKFHRLTLGGVVRLMGAYIIRCDEIVKDKLGNIDHLNCSIVYDAENLGIKAKGTIHWLSRNHCKQIETRHYSNILKDGEVFDKDNLENVINPNSLLKHNGFIENYALKLPNKQLQFIRLGYYYLDKYSTKDNLIYNEIVSLKDSK